MQPSEQVSVCLMYCCMCSRGTCLQPSGQVSVCLTFHLAGNVCWSGSWRLITPRSATWAWPLRGTSPLLLLWSVSGQSWTRPLTLFLLYHKNNGKFWNNIQFCGVSTAMSTVHLQKPCTSTKLTTKRSKRERRGEEKEVK